LKHYPPGLVKHAIKWHQADGKDPQILKGGLDAGKPAAGKEGRIYFAVDTYIFYYDNGTTWVKAGVVDFADLEGLLTREQCSPGVTFEAGVRVTFFQASAPTGWTQVTEQNDRMLRVVSGAGGGTGGDWSGTITDTVASHYHTQPTHQHTAPCYGDASKIYAGDPFGYVATSYTINYASRAGSALNVYLAKTSSAGGENTGSAGGHSHQFYTSWRPAYIDIIVCQRG